MNSRNSYSYACPLPPRTCKWEGTLDEIVAHLAGQNHSVRVSQATIAETATIFFDAEPLEDGYDFQIQSYVSVNASFIVIFSIQTTFWNKRKDEETHSDSFEAKLVYSALVQCIGAKDVASQYYYRMELVHDGRKLIYEDVPLSIEDDIWTAMKRGNCLRLNSETTESFKASAFTLPIYVKITKTE